MKKTMDLPGVWKDCPDTGDADHFEIKCPKCVRDNKLRKTLFIPKSEAVHEGLEYTGVQRYYLSKTRATIAYLIAAVITVIEVFTLLPPGKKYIQGAVYIVGIPVLAVWTFILRLLFRTGMGIWKYTCDNCGQKLAIVSNGKTAAYGPLEEKNSDKKIEGGEKVEGKALDSLILDLKNGDSGVRERAVGALAEIEDSRKIEPLIEALKDEEKRVRKRVALALVATGNRRAIESLFCQSQTDENNSVRGHMRFVIANHIKGILTARYILKGMESKDERIRDLAYEAFINQNDCRALENLKQALKDSTSVNAG